MKRPAPSLSPKPSAKIVQSAQAHAEIEGASASASPASSRTLSLEPENSAPITNPRQDDMNGQASLPRGVDDPITKADPTYEALLEAYQQEMNSKGCYFGPLDDDLSSDDQTDTKPSSSVPKDKESDVDPAMLAQYLLELEDGATKCGGPLDDEDETNYYNTEGSGHKAKPKGLDFGNLPLIDIWVAQAKGLTQEEIKNLNGYAGKERERGDGCDESIDGCDA
jgi:hypothetical protein